MPKDEKNKVMKVGAWVNCYFEVSVPYSDDDDEDEVNEDASDALSEKIGASGAESWMDYQIERVNEEEQT
jgi:hypothetical protein